MMGLTMIETSELLDAPSLSVTSKLKIKSEITVTLGAIICVVKADGELIAAAGPLVCRQIIDEILPSGSDASPDRIVDCSEKITWGEPADTLGGMFKGVTVMLILCVAESPSSSVAVISKLMTVLAVTIGEMKLIVEVLLPSNSTTGPAICCH